MSRAPHLPRTLRHLQVMFWRSVLDFYRNGIFLIVCGFIILGYTAAVAGYRCYECSYTNYEYQGDYNCVTSPWNATNGRLRECEKDTAETCVTKTVYTKDRTRIYFMYRNCSIPDTFDCGMSCCVNDSMHDYTCQHHCRDDLCNNIDEGARLMRSQAHQKNPGSGALSVLHKFIRMTVCMGLLFTIIFKSIFIDSNVS